MEILEQIHEAHLLWIEKNYAYMLFEEILKKRWEEIAVMQGGTI